MIKKIYLAGPMSGLPDKNFPAFNAEAARLRALGFEVINPAELESKVGVMDYMDYLKRDIAELVFCDGVALLPNYDDSLGALIEFITSVILTIPTVPSYALLVPPEQTMPGLWTMRKTAKQCIVKEHDRIVINFITEFVWHTQKTI